MERRTNYGIACFTSLSSTPRWMALFFVSAFLFLGAALVYCQQFQRGVRLFSECLFSTSVRFP